MVMTRSAPLSPAVASLSSTNKIVDRPSIKLKFYHQFSAGFALSAPQLSISLPAAPTTSGTRTWIEISRQTIRERPAHLQCPLPNRARSQASTCTLEGGLVTRGSETTSCAGSASCLKSNWKDIGWTNRVGRNRFRCRSAGSEVKGGTTTSTMTATEESTVSLSDSLLPLEPDFYRIGYVRHVRAYGIEFKEGRDGVGVYAAKDIPHLKKPRIIMEIPLELMITVRKHPPWMFEPDIVPLGHPIFDVINSTDAEMDWDIRLACLLLLAFDQQDNFWQLYGDFLPEVNDCSCLLLATEEELKELQDDKLALRMWEQQRRAHNTWTKYWKAGSPLKLKRLVRTCDHFKWALSMVWSRSFTMTMSIGALVQEANMLIPYADMMNHSFYPTCSYRWRRKDRMLEVIINAGQTISKGDEMTLNYMGRLPNEYYISQYGFSSLANPWDVVNFSGKAKIHLDSFLSAFNIAGLPDEYYYNDAVQGIDDFVDGAVIAAARTLPSWSDKDLPFLPTIEKTAVKELQKECTMLLDAYPTTWEDDLQLLNRSSKRKSQRWKAILRYRMHRKWLIRKIMTTLDLYLERLMF